MLPTRGDAPLADGAVLALHGELTLALVQIEAYDFHDGWPPGSAPRRRHETVSAWKDFGGALDATT
jgi:hypothetical protein